MWGFGGIMKIRIILASLLTCFVVPTTFGMKTETFSLPAYVNAKFGFNEGTEKYQKLLDKAKKGLGIKKPIFLRVHNDPHESIFVSHHIGNQFSNFLPSQYHIILFNQQFCEKNKLPDDAILFAFGHECAHIIAPRHTNNLITEKWCDITAAQKLNCAHGGVLLFRLMKEKFPLVGGISNTHPTDSERISYLVTFIARKPLGIRMKAMLKDVFTMNMLKIKEKLATLIAYCK